MPDLSIDSGSRVLVTGASGYVGGRLVRRLVERGFEVRALARQPSRLAHRFSDSVEIARGDVLEREDLDRALTRIDAAFYLVHSMGSAGSFEETDRVGARNFAEAAKAAGVRRLIYLGGLGSPGDELSPHLRSRQEVGNLLRSSGVPTIELRASIVIGKGSLSFEMVRSLVDRLPVMVTPKWVSIEAQPIAIGDLLDYLVASLELQTAESRVYEIGGPEVTSYGGLLEEYARQTGRRRWMISVPVLTPWLSSLWLGLVTPLYARVGRALIESIRHPTIVGDPSALRDFHVRPVGVREAMARALAEDGRS